MFPTAHGVVSQGGKGGAPDPGGGLTGIIDEGSLATINLGDWQMGWEFKVGPGPITAIAGRVRTAHATPLTSLTVKLWRVSDQTLLSETNAFTAAGGGAWTVEPFPTPVPLGAGENYAVTVHRGGSSMNNTPQNTNVSATATFAPEISHVQGRRLSGAGFPTNTAANAIFGLADIVFT